MDVIPVMQKYLRVRDRMSWVILPVNSPTWITCGIDILLLYICSSHLYMTLAVKKGCKTPTTNQPNLLLYDHFWKSLSPYNPTLISRSLLRSLLSGMAHEILTEWYGSWGPYWVVWLMRSLLSGMAHEVLTEWYGSWGPYWVVWLMRSLLSGMAHEVLTEWYGSWGP